MHQRKYDWRIGRDLVISLPDIATMRSQPGCREILKCE
ncbi:hypothetical protein PUN28_014275 [Cardiocondyla obscurior]|uniref:Uncharacterized protein n=1 Tax=Cardiocondyla obscurior TaxID=286306 RepID=A0AAW2EZ89_9HYME